MPIERIQAPSAGINTDAGPDYLGATEAVDLVNFLPGLAGKLVRRGQFFVGVDGFTNTSLRPDALWVWDDIVLVKGNPGGGTKTWRATVSDGAAQTDVTATLVESPLDYRHVRYGDYTFGAIVDANSPALGRWDGGATPILEQTNAPYQWTDLQVHAERLFILGGSVPGTTTPANARTLYWTDPGATFATVTGVTGVAATDVITATAHGYANGTQITFPALTGGAGLTVNAVYYVITATTNTFQVALTVGGAAVDFTTAITAGTVARADWYDDVSGLVNRLDYHSDDTPVGLAGCGRFMAILGTRSINILTGTGSSSFAIRNLTKNMGCTDVNSIVEVDDGFYFMSDRGFTFCDGSAVVVVSDQKLSQQLVGLTGSGWTAAMFTGGYIGLCSDVTLGKCWLYNIGAKAWTTITIDIGATQPVAVFRTLTYPLMWQSGGYRRGELVGQPSIDAGIDHAVASPFTTVKCVWRSRFVPLASPAKMANVQRLLLDYLCFSSGAAGWLVDLVDTQGTALLSSGAPATQAISATQRSRFQTIIAGEADAIQLVVRNNGSLASGTTAEVYDAYVEFSAGRDRPTI